MNIAKLQYTKPFMPPFAGNAPELEAVVQMVTWASDGRPSEWRESDDPQVIEQIDRWLAEAGTARQLPGAERTSPGEDG